MRIRRGGGIRRGGVEGECGFGGRRGEAGVGQRRRCGGSEPALLEQSSLIITTAALRYGEQAHRRLEHGGVLWQLRARPE